MTDLTDQHIGTPPPLFAASLLYLIAFVGTASLVIGLGQGIESGLVRFVAALIFAGGGTVLALALSQTALATILGRGLHLWQFVWCIGIGVLLWLPATWILYVATYGLTVGVGALATPQPLTDAARPAIVALQLGVIVPLCQGIFMWGFFQSAAGRLGRGRGAILAAFLFGLFGLVATEFGMAAIPAWWLVGGFAAYTSYATRSAWGGIALAGGWGAVRPLIERTQAEFDLFYWLGGERQNDPGQLFEGRWLLAAAFLGFLAFAALQVIRVLNSPDIGSQTTSAKNPPQKSVWWLPLAAAFVFTIFLGYGEISLRALNNLRPQPIPDGTTTIPPLAPTEAPPP